MRLFASTNGVCYEDENSEGGGDGEEGLEGTWLSRSCHPTCQGDTQSIIMSNVKHHKIIIKNIFLTIHKPPVH